MIYQRASHLLLRLHGKRQALQHEDGDGKRRLRNTFADLQEMIEHEDKESVFFWKDGGNLWQSHTDNHWQCEISQRRRMKRWMRSLELDTG